MQQHPTDADARPSHPRQGQPPAVPLLPSVEASIERIDRRVAHSRRDHAALALLAVALGPVTLADGTPQPQMAPALAQEFTRRLRARVRCTDDVWQSGPDEWVVLLPLCRPEGARAAARRLTSLLSAPYGLDGTLLLTRARLGMANLRVDGDSGSALLATAQAALDFEEARQVGRRSVSDA